MIGAGRNLLDLAGAAGRALDSVPIPTSKLDAFTSDSGAPKFWTRITYKDLKPQPAASRKSQRERRQPDKYAAYISIPDDVPEDLARGIGSEALSDIKKAKKDASNALGVHQTVAFKPAIGKSRKRAGTSGSHSASSSSAASSEKPVTQAWDPDADNIVADLEKFFKYDRDADTLYTARLGSP